MRFGVWHDLRNPARWRRSYAELYQETLEQIVWAESAGFESVQVSEHHVTDEGYLPSVFPFLAAIAARTTTIRLGSAVLLAPLHHPLRFAEDAAFVDQLSAGRLELGLGLGYRRDEFRALGVPRPERGTRTEELIEVARRAWTGEPFTHTGPHWSFEDVVVTPTPFRPGGPPLWLGGGTAKAAERAGRLGCHFMPDAYIAIEHYATYREALMAAGHDPAKFEVALNPTVYVTEDPERAWAEIGEHLLFQFNRYREWFAAGGDEPAATAASPDELPRERYLIGTPEQVIEGIEGLHERQPFDRLFFWSRFPGLPLEASQSSLELFVERVLPHFAEETRVAG
ncbi:MAG: LLM class flavin-dependent oxidoreductase [Actinobacteria bacterium]|nr:LLM class flavin-dependent oxidoreductase [Actinomycetota bacterium]